MTINPGKFGRGRHVALQLVLSIIALCAPGGTHATTLLRLSLAQMAQAADTVVRARCVTTASRWDGGAIWTFAQVDVVESFKGSPPTRLQVRLPGGRVGHLITNVEDAPRLQTGEEKILFLEKNVAGDYSVTGWVEGTFRIRKNLNGEETITQDSSEVAVFDPATRQFRTEGLRNLSMSDFRQRVAAALAAGRAGFR